LLVSMHDGRPFASHLPFLLDSDVGDNGTLMGHMARANPQWTQIAGQTALALFSGPHAYVSPTWYQADHVVPTWNYVAVHAYGTVEVIEDSKAILDIVQKSVAQYERPMMQPWSFDESAPFIERLLAQIVGFRIQIEHIEGKWKLNQNHPEGRRQSVIEALQQQGDADALAIAKLMARMLEQQEQK
jgi:transcriptional regulator